MIHLNYLHILFLNTIIAMIFIAHGIFFLKKILKLNNTENNIYEYGLFGIISISLYSLILNFFFPLSNYLNLILLFVPIIFVLKSLKRKFFLYAAIVGLISFIIMILENSNRPDAGLYHLPFIKILNEYKIIFGLSNLHFRYGHTSILQYLAAPFNNFLFTENGILIPLAQIFSFVVLFFFHEIKNKDHSNFYKLLIFLFLFNVLISMNRYSEFGNDHPAHMFFFLSIIKLFNNSYKSREIQFIKILFYSLYAFLIKTFLIFSFLIPLFFLYKEKNFFVRIFFTKKNLIVITIIALWLIKNFIISGCLIYPLNITCGKNISWSSYSNKIANPKTQEISGEAWAKSFPDRNNKNIIEKEFISNLDWVNSWVKVHFIIVINNLLPILLLVFLLKLIKYNNLAFEDLIFFKKEVIFLLLLSFFSSLYWFFKFPLFRYGSSYLFSLIIFIYISSFYFENKNFFYQKKIKLLTNIILIIFIVILLKNVKRYYLNYNQIYNDYPWPKKNSFTMTNEKFPNKEKSDENNKVIYYYSTSPDGLCMFSIKAPCSMGNSDVIGEVKKKIILFNYSFFYN
jgi:hypothetical protein